MKKSQRALVGLAVLQGILLVGFGGSRVLNRAQTPIGFMEVGDTLLALEPNDDRDVYKLTSSGRGTAVIAFRSTCQWCDSAAPTIAQWIAKRPHDLRVVAVSPEPYQIAVEYARSKRWEVTVFPINEDAGTAHHQVMGRTPWIFFFDPHGVLRHSHHAGALIDSIQ